MSKLSTAYVTLTPHDNLHLSLVLGPQNEHIALIEKRLEIDIKNRGHDFTLQGEKTAVSRGAKLLQELYARAHDEGHLELDEIHLALYALTHKKTNKKDFDHEIAIKIKKGVLRPRSQNQAIYLKNILTHDINFGIGPAGTGKTYLAVACAVEALEKDLVERIILVRPAVEAGEKLGFLPGDLAEKVNPYLRPLYDALYEMLGFEKVKKLLEKDIIEIAPLAYMRGRTLNHAFIILDESQNTTQEQMKMFLTRIGFGAKAVITGDVTQIDLVHGQRSGLLHVAHILQHVKGISFTHFESKDVVRHPLVQHIIDAYDKAYKKET